MTAKAEAIKPVYALVGEESFLRREALAAIRRAAQTRYGGVDLTRVDGDRAELAAALDELNTGSLLGGMRMVVVDEADEFISRNRKKLEDTCAAPPADACLVLICKSLPRNTRLYKAIAANGEVIACEAQPAKELVGWITTRCHEAHQKKIDRLAAERLLDLIGNSLGCLDNELGKLSLYVAGRERIEPQDVDALVGTAREEVVFRVTDALAAGNAAGALAAWRQVLATDRAAPARAVAGLASGFRRLLEVRQHLDSGGNVQGLVSRMGPVAYFLSKQVNRFRAEQLTEQLRDLCEIDQASKTGLAEVDAAVDVFIVKHAGRSPAGRAVAGRRT